MAVGERGLEGKGDWTGDWDGREGREGRVPSALAGDFDDAVDIDGLGVSEGICEIFSSSFISGVFQV